MAQKVIQKKQGPKAQVPAKVEVAGDKPAYLQELEKRGPVQNRDNFDSTDVTIPRIKLLQALSAEIENFDTAKAGIFWHTGLDLPLDQEFPFVIVSRRKRYLLVAPLEDGQGILARSEDFINWVPPHGRFEIKIKGRKTPVVWTLAPTVAESGLDKWGSYNPDDENSPPAATIFYEYLILLPEHMDFGPVVLSLTRSQIKKAKKGLNDKIQMHASAGRPMQALIFVAKVVKEEGQEGAYFNFQFTSGGFAPKPIFDQAWEMKDALRIYRVQDEEGAARGQDEGITPEDPKDY
jgi:hypothetical protein